MYPNHAYLDNNMIFELKERHGIGLEPVIVQKNGTELTGIRVRTDEMSGIFPVVYPSAEETPEELKDRIVRAAHAALPAVNIAKLTDFSFVRDRLFLTVRRRGSEDIVKRDYLNLELIPRIFLEMDGSTGTVKVTPGLLDAMGVPAQTIFETAAENSRSLYTVRSMSELLGAILGTEDAEYDGGGLYVVVAANGSSIDAAPALYFPEVFRDFCSERGESDCLIIPSSIHEVLIVPGSRIGSDDDTLRQMSGMVDEINNGIVDEFERLDPVIYRYSVVTDEIVIAADAREGAEHGR